MNRILFRQKDLSEILNCGKTKAAELPKDPTFPKLFPLNDGGRAKFGFIRELEAWLEQRAAKSGERAHSEAGKGA